MYSLDFQINKSLLVAVTSFCTRMLHMKYLPIDCYCINIQINSWDTKYWYVLLVLTGMCDVHVCARNLNTERNTLLMGLYLMDHINSKPRKCNYIKSYCVFAIYNVGFDQQMWSSLQTNDPTYAYRMHIFKIVLYNNLLTKVS